MKSYLALNFLCIIFAFCFTHPKTLGCDNLMEVDPKTGVTHITVHGITRNCITPTKHQFAIIKLLHSSPILYGHGTWVWIVKDKQGSFFVLKDSWIQQASKALEIQLIRHIEKIVGEDPDGPFFKHAHQQYYIGQESICITDTIRGLLPDKPLMHVQRRIITGPIGDPITSFHSKHEFVTIMLDIVNCEFYLHKLWKLNDILDSLGVPLWKSECYSWWYINQQYLNQLRLGLCASRLAFSTLGIWYKWPGQLHA